ncbi:bifunctional UDP-N-acetylglucosamine diphosphorylase/glucosamine-1-phosphate N-acetyltransferase GlmU [Agrococcus sp. HG114]|uniref:bifunctional UDP-N-acetylglucosamine diphosphorylase/glucosamine-1-phosphate N-acetyltransferase GlmU n=1 Tax=Agrococcus sp. HG114 TaxID=2969757 RepID=UPI00215B243E|nr:bifunctional UDP-N-acetylglucosamine diphosphorylase/glucosamine-1-phosphate N-acetyltransferase GlmU [Agrococcus sp. HG114]MCR8669806.1 bifunctional UDP-N-acetylglucosamine diphosphorylase/glucosamine-1-phosphate N-acetyltransferase GlmU [Agrococcus sp. HG114]
MGESVPSIAVIVLAAGAGTRMKSRTPKPLHALAGKPLIAHVLRTANELHPERIVAVVRHERDRMAEAVLEFAPHVLIADQDEIPGTGRAVEQALDAIADFDGHVVVLSGDVPLIDAETLGALIERHEREGNQMTLLSAHLSDPSGLGRIVRDEAGSFMRIVEQKDASDVERAIDEVNGGIYVFDASALRQALRTIDRANAQGEMYLTDAAVRIQATGGRIEAVPAPDEWAIWGINDRVQLAAAAHVLNDRIIRRWQRDGVTIVDPASTWIDIDVTLAEDVTILPGTQLHGATAIAAGATIGPDTTLVDTEVGEDAVVKRTDATLSVIGARASVGPWAYLRPNSVVGEDGKVGTFVETKNTQIGAGSKIPHLSYIGDTTIGEGSNIGAGTITANYDGVAKHRTTVGSHVRTGSDNVFVAPVTIGDGAYTGAGTIVRKDVEPGALAISVAPQRTMSGWVEANRPGTKAADAAAAAGTQAPNA